jgi:hypothetical protein
MDRRLPMVLPAEDICDNCPSRKQCIDRDCYLEQYALCYLQEEPSFKSEAELAARCEEEIARIYERKEVS